MAFVVSRSGQLTSDTDVIQSPVVSGVVPPLVWENQALSLAVPCEGACEGLIGRPSSGEGG